MRILVTIAHYFKSAPAAEWGHSLGSARDPISRIAALNSEIVALHRYFGPRRLALNVDKISQDKAPLNTLDIVIMTVKGANLLDEIDIDDSQYSVAFFDGPPMELAFEAQRIMRERSGRYDLYVYLEDDVTIVDPEFFNKIVWFTNTFGPDVMLLPTRYEMSCSKTLAKIAFDPRLSDEEFNRLSVHPQPAALQGDWHGHMQTFRKPSNPHAACFCVTDQQLQKWMASPSFYDRDSSWIDALVSASTYAPAKIFSIYHPAEPDPYFLAIEHYGARYSFKHAGPDETFGESPLLSRAENGNDPTGPSLNSLVSQMSKMQDDLSRFRNSRSALAKAWMRAIWKKA